MMLQYIITFLYIFSVIKKCVKLPDMKIFNKVMYTYNSIIKISLVFYLFLSSGYSVKCQVISSMCFIITKTTSNCNGANRTEENLDNNLQKMIARKEIFYIINGKKNIPNRKIVKSFTIGNEKSKCIFLPPGTYSVINKFSYNKLVVEPNQFDIACMQQLWATPLFSFTINKNKCDTIIYNIALPCDYNKPCAKLNSDIPM